MKRVLCHRSCAQTRLRAAALPDRHRWPCCAPHARRHASPALAAAASVGEVADSIPDAKANRAKGRNLVVAIDHSEAAWKAVKWTLENLYREGDVLHFLHVVPQGFSNVAIPTTHLHQPPLDDDTQDQVAAQSHAFIQRTFVVLAAQHDAKCEIDLVKGGCREAVGAAICKKSDALSAAAVVVPWARKSLLEELFLGASVARHVSVHCKQPTIVLH